MAKKISRREFLKRSAASAAAVAIAPHLRLLPGTNVSWAAGPGDAIVVFVQLNGGNDGMNTVYPLTGNQRTLYEQYRPTLKLPATTPELQPWQDVGLPLTAPLSVGTNADGAEYALHPAMISLHDLYQQGRVAIANGVHYPFANRSHFRSEAIWYSADPLGTSGLGWFGKYLDYAGFTATDVPAVILGRQLNPTFTPTSTSLLAFRRLSELEFPAEGEQSFKQDKFSLLYDESAASDPNVLPELSKIGQTGGATIDTIAQYYVSGNGLSNAGKVEALMLNASGVYRRNNSLVYSSPLNPEQNAAVSGMRLVRDLRHVAATIRADVGARFFHVQTGGFDSHSSQEQGLYHSTLLYQVSEAIAAFYSEMNQTVTLPAGYNGYLTGNLGSKVVIVTFSEFGRTIRQNASSKNSAGTDHGTSAPQFVVGAPVIGGQYGAYPQLDNPGAANKDDLRMSIDFRDLWGTLLERWLGVPAVDVGPGAGKILPATPSVDENGASYTAYTPLGFLAP